MRKRFPHLISISFIFIVVGCAAGIKPSSYEFESTEHKVLYDLMVERCDAINARDRDRLKKIYSEESTELSWLSDIQMPEYERWGITHTVVELDAISIVGVDAAGTFVIRLDGRLNRSPYGKVDVLYVKEGTEWKIESVAER